ncbi:SecDF P1 head subdomain-containing protein [Planctomycetes bacterium TBK1r]|uniref:Preprotein translocase subunit SecD n=1 Tax=Stieleria magnilauensis TaxID=2527963 RepID=A0ABX5XWV1_9BACT|nr:preprotein translocase subunit SecD [Planctomycetes bacterium TBK1r]
MNQHHPPSRRKTILAVAVTVWVAIAVGLVFFAKTSVEGTRIEYQIESSDVRADQIVSAVERRLNGFFDGAKEIRVIEDGRKLQIDLETTDSAQLDAIATLLHHEGHLRFLALAQPGRHDAVIDAASAQIDSGDRSLEVRDASDALVGRWALIDQSIDPMTGWPKPKIEPQGLILRDFKTGALVDLASSLQTSEGQVDVGQWMFDNNVTGLEALAIVEPDVQLDGDSLSFAAITEDANGQLAVSLEFTTQGSTALETLTKRYVPVGQRQTRLGIIFDDVLITAPKILQPIRKQAVITGDFEKAEVQTIIAVLKAGRLPIELPEQPVRREPVTLTKPLLQWPL